METSGDRKLCPMLMAANLTHKDARGDESPELQCQQESCAWWPMCSAAAVWSRAAFVDPEGRLHISVMPPSPDDTVSSTGLGYCEERIGTGDGSVRRFHGVLRHYFVAATLTFRAGGQFVRDDGRGCLTGDVDNFGTNVVAAKPFDFTFCRAPSPDTAVFADYRVVIDPDDTVAPTELGQDYLNLEEEFEDLKKQANKLELELYVARSVKAGLAGHLDIPEDTPFQEIQRLVVKDMGRTDVYEQALRRIYESRLDANEARVEARKALEEAGPPARLGNGDLR